MESVLVQSNKNEYERFFCEYQYTPFIIDYLSRLTEDRVVFVTYSQRKVAMMRKRVKYINNVAVLLYEHLRGLTDCSYVVVHNIKNWFSEFMFIFKQLKSYYTFIIIQDGEESWAQEVRAHYTWGITIQAIQGVLKSQIVTPIST